jgi:hypothetical protein
MGFPKWIKNIHINDFRYAILIIDLIYLKTYTYAYHIHTSHARSPTNTHLKQQIHTLLEDAIDRAEQVGSHMQQLSVGEILLADRVIIMLASVCSLSAVHQVAFSTVTTQEIVRVTRSTLSTHKPTVHIATVTTVTLVTTTTCNIT